MATSFASPVTSASDLMADVTSDIQADFAAADTSGDEITSDIDTSSDDGLGDLGAVGDEPTTDDDAAAEEQAAETTPVAAATTEELPEGVSTGSRSGKPGLFVDKSRWDNAIYPAYKQIQEVAQILGEPVSAEAIKLRQEAMLANDRLFTDLNSADPVAHGRVIDYILEDMQRAHQEGEAPANPAIPFAQQFYERVKERQPDAYATLRMAQFRDLIGEVYQEAATSNNQMLWHAAGHLVSMLAGSTDPKAIANRAAELGVPFHHDVAQMQAMARQPNPQSALQQENLRLRNDLAARQSRETQSQYASWRNETGAELEKGLLDDALKPALASVEEAYKKFPDVWNELQTSLHKKVNEVIQNDKPFQDRMRLILAKARNGSAQVRQRVKAELRTAYVNRAKLAAEGLRPEVLKSHATRLKTQASQNNERRQAGVNRTAPNGTSSSAARSLTPPPVSGSGAFNPKQALREAQQYFK